MIKGIILLDTNILLYLFFIGCFIVFAFFTIMYNRQEAMDNSSGYNRQYTLYHYKWDELNAKATEYENLLAKYKQKYPIVWNVGKIKGSSYITTPSISINQSSTLPNVYLDITFPYPMKGEKGLPGEPGDVGIDGLMGNPGPIGEQGIPYPCGKYS